MIAIPARVSPIPSLPASPVRSAAPAVVIRQTVEPAAATPAVTIHSAQRSTVHSHPHPHTHSHHSYTPYYPPTAAATATAAVVATPAAVVHDYHSTHHPTHDANMHYAAVQQQHDARHTHGAYCDHHAPLPAATAVTHKPAAYAPVVYAQPTHSAIAASPRHSHSPHLVYQQAPPSPPTHYEVVYEGTPTAPAARYPLYYTTNEPAHYYTHHPQSAPAPAMYGVAIPKPSLSPPQKPLSLSSLHRPTAMAPPLSLSTGGGSAFTPVQPIAMYPRTGILIQ